MSTADRFDEALQPRTMGPRLAAAYGGPSSCHVLDAKYEPGVCAVILYEHAGRLLRGDLLQDADEGTGDDTGRTLVLAPGVRITGFPDDPELPALPEVMDAGRLGPRLAAALRNSSGTPRPPAPVRCRTSLLRYRPGKRATVLAAFVPETERYVVKAYHDPAKAAAVAREGPALAAALDQRGTLRLAPTVAHLPGLSLVVQRAVTGTPLDALLGGRRGSVPGARRAMVRAGQALAELHQLGPVTSRQRPVERELLRFGSRAERIHGVDAEVGAAAGLLASRLLDSHAQLPAPRVGLVHGDCKPSQFLLAGPQVLLMDLDHVGVSDQAVDVGTFLASLRQLEVRCGLTAGARGRSVEVAELSAAFLEGYRRTRGDDALGSRVGWQQAVALERKALRAFARAPRSPLVSALLQEANRCVDDLVEAS